MTPSTSAPTYADLWEAVREAMREKLGAVAAELPARGYSLGTIEITGDDDLQQSAVLYRDGDDVGAVYFTLHESPDGDGGALSMTWETGDGRLAAHRWAPDAFTAEAFTSDARVLLNRISELPPADVAGLVARDMDDLLAAGMAP